MQGGKKIWYFADGYIPAPSKGGMMEGHEALMLFNTQEEAAEVLMDVYFSDRPPVKGIKLSVPAERTLSLRMDKKEEIGCEIPLLTQYALRLRSSCPIIVQFGRLDTTQSNMSYYVGTPFWEEE